MKKILVTIMMLLPMMVMAYDFEVDGIFYNIISIEEKTVEVTYSTDLNYQQNYIVIPAEVTWNNYAFSVKGIGRSAFDSGNYPNKVDTIIISKGIEYIGELAFQSQRLKKIQIPNTVKNIESNAFSSGNEQNIMTDWYVEDYEWLCTIGHYFSYPHVKDIYVDNKKLDGDFIIPEGVSYIISNFWGCDWIKTLTIPSTVSYISGSFIRCTNLESVEIKEGVNNLYGQFNGCTNLKSVTLPNSLVSIGDLVFKNCPALIDIQSFITEPFPTDGFTNGQYLSATLKVPYGTKGKYQNTEGWKNFVNIEEAFTVKGNEVCLNKSEAILEKGKTMTLKATVYPETLGDKSVTWKSSNTAVATVSSKGKVKGVKAGIVTITCTSVATGAKATCKVTVGYVKLDKTEAILEKGETMTLMPTVYPSKLTDRSVTWKSSDETIAKVTSSGEVTGVNAGTAVITCTSVATGLSTTCTVTVVSNVTLDKTEAILKKGKTMTLKATVSSEIDDKSVTWKSSDKTIATVTSAGKVKGVKSGVVTITCTSVATGAKATCKVTVGTITLNKSSVTIKKGRTVTLKPTVYPTTLEDQSVTWKSSDETIATVTSAGKVKGVKSGTATITCTSNAMGLSTTCKVTVGTVILNLSQIAINKGKTITLEADVYPTTLEDQSVTWKSSDETVATVSSDGKVNGVAAGTATITCTSVATGLSTTCKVTVTDFTPARTMLGEDDTVTDIKMVEETPATEQPFDVYDLKGHRMLHQVTSLDALPAGVYIVNGKKMLKK